MAVRVAINGFGRIGRNFFRAAWGRGEIEIVAVNDIVTPDIIAHLLKYDSTYGVFKSEVREGEGCIFVGERRVNVYSIRSIEELPWGDLGVDFVLESTGLFRRRADCEKHLEAGAKKVVLSAPAKDEVDATVVLGVNDHVLTPDVRIVSNASCTTNCLAPMVKVLDEVFGIEWAIMTTVHAVTNDQRLLDRPHKDLRRARSAISNIIPTTTGAAVATGIVYPKLAGRITGLSIRVPIPTGSIVDLTALLKRRVTTEDVNNAFRKAAEEQLKGILEYTEAPIVSSDIVGNPHSCILDAASTMVEGDLVKVLGWYDNEWGYSNRCVDLVLRLANI